MYIFKRNERGIPCPKCGAFTLQFHLDLATGDKQKLTCISCDYVITYQEEEKETT